MKAITSNQAKEQLDELIEQVILDVEPTIVCNDQGKQAVLMSLDEFNAWQERLHLLSNPANAEHSPEPRKPGYWRSRVKIAKDFDSLPDSILKGFMGEAE